MILAAAVSLVAYAVEHGMDVEDQIVEEVWSRPAGVYTFSDGVRTSNTPGMVLWRALGSHIFDWNW